ncbi:MAG: hypothetical protein AAF489_14670 [Bacteroidota bacterium]
MKAVKVQYTVKPEYINENKKNIEKVMGALRVNPIKGMQYSAFVDQENPNTFIHINMAIDDDTMAKINEVQEFRDFRQALKASQPLVSPSATKLKPVGHGFDLT